LKLDDEGPDDEQEEQHQDEGGGGTHGAADDSGVVNEARTLRFVTREGCGRCAAALARLQRVAARLAVPVVVEDVDASLALYQAYTDRVPVVLDGEGRVVAEGRLTGGTVLWAVLRARMRRDRARGAAQA